eukprot:1045855-Pyramimonas_sp.AAC.1
MAGGDHRTHEDGGERKKPFAKKAKRLNLRFDCECPDKFQRRLRTAQRLRVEAESQLRLHLYVNQ